MTGQGFLEQAFVYLCAAVVAVPLAARLGLGSITGYLLAGVAIGPFALGLVGAEGQDVMSFAQFGRPGRAPRPSVAQAVGTKHLEWIAANVPSRFEPCSGCILRPCFSMSYGTDGVRRCAAPGRQWTAGRGQRLIS